MSSSYVLSVAIHVHLVDFMLNGRQVWIYRYNSDSKKEYGCT